MNKIPCNIIRDLLVLYDDNMCSEESRAVIQNHICECDECRKIYEQAQTPLPDIKDSSDDQWEIIAQAFRKWTRKVSLKHASIFAIIILVISASYIIWKKTLEENFLTVPSRDIQVTELYELKNGDIYCTLQTEKPFFTVSGGIIQTPSEYWEKDYSEGWHEIWLKSPSLFQSWLSDTVTMNEVSLVLPLKDIQAAADMPEGASSAQDFFTHQAVAIYYRDSDDDKTLLWKEGQVLEAAPQELEDKVAQEIVEIRHYDPDASGSAVLFPE